MANLKSTTINDTGFLQLPSGTTAERPQSPTASEIRFNTDTKVCEWYDSELDSWFPTGVIPPVATGGDTVEDVDIDGVTYRIHSFTTVGSSDFTVTRGGLVDYLLVAGGGGGAAAGGGAGGLLHGRSIIHSQTYSIFVGEGGSAGDSPFGSSRGLNGKNSSFLNLTALGGGGGGAQQNTGRAGGSGGGCGTNEGSLGGAGTPGQGNPGGFAPNTSRPNSTGGGGGAGEPGGDSTRAVGGNGGTGIFLGNLFGSSLGENGFFAGGGAGGPTNPTSSAPEGTAGSPGLGGGAGGNELNVSGRQAMPNTGGGGRHGDDHSNNPGNGGSGIVIIRYRIS